MPQRQASHQRQLFEQQPPPAPAVRLPANVQEQLRQVLVHWLQALARTLREKGGGDE